MNQYQNYAIETMVKGWTRIDMLLALYDRAISTIEDAKLAKESACAAELANKLIESQRLVLALHSGLNTDKFELAADVARLLNFVLLRLQEQNFDEANYFLGKLRASFAEIRDDATAMEKEGKIPPLSTSRGLDTVA